MVRSPGTFPTRGRRLAPPFPSDFPQWRLASSLRVGPPRMRLSLQYCPDRVCKPKRLPGHLAWSVCRVYASPYLPPYPPLRGNYVAMHVTGLSRLFLKLFLHIFSTSNKIYSRCSDFKPLLPPSLHLQQVIIHITWKILKVDEVFALLRDLIISQVYAYTNLFLILFLDVNLSSLVTKPWRRISNVINKLEPGWGPEARRWQW